jgi:voltage-gated sodium channel
MLHPRRLSAVPERVNTNYTPPERATNTSFDLAHARIGRVNARVQIKRFVDDRRFQRFIAVVIVVNALTLGLETSSKFVDQGHDLLSAVDRIALGIFVVELALRFIAYGFRFFADPWSVFDVIVVGIAFVPTAGPFLVLRAFRALRIMRLVSVLPRMRRLASGILRALPGMASVGALIMLIIYVAGVVATNLFGQVAPDYFDDLGTSLFTLFQAMTGEGWPDIAREVMAKEPLAWIFFVVYIVVCTLAVLNILIAVIVSGMEQASTDEIVEMEEKQAQSDEVLLTEIRALRDEVRALREERG